jgi:hypothetical protein
MLLAEKRMCQELDEIATTANADAIFAANVTDYLLEI